MADVTISYKGSAIAELSAQGTKALKTSGKYCEGDITVAYVPPTPVVQEVDCKKFELDMAQGSGWIKLIDLPADVLAHINDPAFTVTLMTVSEYAVLNYSGCVFVCGNQQIGASGSYPVYGLSTRQQNDTTFSQSGIFYPANNTGTSISIGGFGIFRVDGSQYYFRPADGFLRAGTYHLIFAW